MQIDIASLGHAPVGNAAPTGDIQKLTAAQRKQLEDVGLIDHDDNWPLWTVKKKYYWQQTFPAHKVIHIRHQYSPVGGSESSVGYGMGSNPTSTLLKKSRASALTAHCTRPCNGLRMARTKTRPLRITMSTSS
jgi:hypothetical protein